MPNMRNGSTKEEEEFLISRDSIKNNFTHSGNDLVHHSSPMIGKLYNNVEALISSSLAHFHSIIAVWHIQLNEAVLK